MTGDAALRRVRLWGGLGLLALAAFLVLAPSPWSVEGGPGFFAEDRGRPLRANVWIGLWWAAALNLGLGALCVASAPLWTRPVPPRASRPAGMSRRLFALLVALAILLGLGLRLPLATKSLWWDEAWTIRQVIVGSFAVTDGDPTAANDLERFKPGGLERALFYAKKPTNHALYSVAAWSTNGVWRSTHDGPPQRFSELAYRLPALLASALCMLGVALLCRELGFARAGPLAALLLALHPWAIRYGTEGRAYGFVMTFTVLGVLAMSRFLRSRRHRDLGAYVVSQVLLVWTWSYAAFVTAGLGAAAGLHVLRSEGSARERRGEAFRLVVAHVLAVMAVVQVFAPNLTLVGTWGVYVGDAVSRLPAVLAGLATGMLWPDGLGDPELPSLSALLESSRLAQAVVLVVLPLVVAGGAVAVCRFDRSARSVLLGWLAAAPLAVIVTQVTGRHFYPRFLMYALPAVVVLAAIGLERLHARCARRWSGARGHGTGLALAGAAVAAWLAVCAPQIQLLLERPYAPLRDTRDSLAPAAIRAGLGFGTSALRVYDPEIRYLDGVADIAAICRTARDAGQPLRIASGYPVHNRERRPAIALLEDATHFTVVAEHRGIEPAFHFRVFAPSGPCPAASPSG
ncbi:MAG: glycosyltransferase family 39 protein [Myxococcota bacterium]|nr:glycosyltransferase family 39 protein [Myxococcota bacterium]